MRWLVWITPLTDFMKAIVLFPLSLAVVLAFFHRTLDGWKYATALAWVLFLCSMAGVWVPAILLPYLRRRAPR